MACSCLSVKTNSSTKPDINTGGKKLDIQELLETAKTDQQFNEIINTPNIDTMLFADVFYNFLNYAVYRGNLRFVKFYLQQIAKQHNLITPDQDNHSILKDKAASDEPTKLKPSKLKSLSLTSLQSTDRYGNTHLHLAAQTGQLEMTRTLLHFTETLLKAQWNVPNKAGDTPRMVAERYQHQQVMMFYDMWQHDGADVIGLTPGNTKRRGIKMRRLSEEVSEEHKNKKEEPNIIQFSEESNEEESSMMEEMLHNLRTISSRNMEIKKGYMITQERSMGGNTDRGSMAQARVDQQLGVILSQC